MTRPLTLLLLLSLFPLAAIAGDDKKQEPRTLTPEERAIAMGAIGGTGEPRLPLLPGVDLSALDDELKWRAYDLLRDSPCTCGCGMNLAECRKKDPNCPVSPGLAQAIVDAVAAGKTDAEIMRGVEPVDARGEPLPRHDFALDDSPSKGPANAAVTIVEFSDFTCDACALANAWLPKLLAAYPDDVRLVYKFWPHKGDQMAFAAAEAGVAAHAQGKFWELHDKMYSNSQAVSQAAIETWASEVGIDTGKFLTGLLAGTHKPKVAADKTEGSKAGVEGTPTFFVNGQLLTADPSYQALKGRIDHELGR